MARTSLGSSPTRSIAGIAAAGLIGIAGLGALSGCGRESFQSKEHSSIAGINASVGTILIRNAAVTLTGSDTAVLTMALFNEGNDGDTLTAVSTSAASDVTLPGSGTVDVPTTAGVFLSTTPATATADPVTSSPVTLSGMKPTLFGSTLSITLTFARAGSTTLSIPVVADTSSSTSPTPSGSDTPSDSTTPSDIPTY